MTQVYWGRSLGVTVANTFANPFSFDDWLASTTEIRTPIEAAGTLRNLRIRLLTAPGAGTSIIFTLMKAAAGTPTTLSATALTVTISDASTIGEDSTNDVTVAAGDIVTIKVTVSGAPAHDRVQGSIEFEPDDDGVSIYGAGSGGNVSRDVVRYQSLFNPEKTWDDTAAEVEEIVATPGAITRYRVFGDNVGGPGSGRNYTFVICKVVAGVETPQDGTGGTTDTTLVLQDTNVSATWTGSIALTAGEVVYLRCTPGTGGARPATERIALGVKFIADTDGLYNVCGHTHGTHGGDAATYDVPTNCSDSAGPSGTENDRENYGGVTTTTLGGLRWRLGTTPGAGKAHILTARLNNASPGGGPVITITDANFPQAVDATGSFAVGPTDEWSMQWSGTGNGPAASRGTWSFVGNFSAGGGAVTRGYPFVGTMVGGTFAG